jgi:hypothetical protein
MKHVLPGIYEKFRDKKDNPISSEKPSKVKKWLSSVKSDNSQGFFKKMKNFVGLYD